MSVYVLAPWLFFHDFKFHTRYTAENYVSLLQGPFFRMAAVAMTRVSPVPGLT